MMTSFYVFSLRMKNEIFGNVNSTRVVTMNTHSTFLNAIIVEHLFHPKELDTTTPCDNIFHFCSGQRSNFASCSARQTIANKEANTKSSFPILYIFALVSIRIPINNKSGIIGVP